MDFGKLIQMVVNLVVRRLLHIGVNKGIDLLASKGKPAAPAAPDEPMTPAEEQAAKQARKAAKRARQAAQITRRLG